MQQKASDPTILLVDNGSTRVDAAVQLRLIAKKLSDKTRKTIHPVSMQHSDRISTEDVVNKLSGKPAQVFRAFMRKQLKQNQRNFVLIPLFFGKSRAITSFVPTEIEKLETEFGSINLSITDELYPLPNGDPKLIEILFQHSKLAIDGRKHHECQNLVLVDHGSPLPTVNAVRQHIASKLQEKLANGIQLKQAAMERRKGNEYDFNGELLQDLLSKLAESGETSAKVLLLFLLPGTHAGKNGDIVQICRNVMDKFPDFTASMSPLIGEHEMLIDCLSDRLRNTLDE